MDEISDYPICAEYLKKLYWILNDKYFNGALGDIVITIQDKASTFGHFSLDKVWAVTNGKMIHPRTVQDHFKRAIKKAGLPNLHFHSLRHTAATLMLFNGVDVRTVQEVLGHEDIQTTLGIYMHVMEDMKRDAQKTIYSSICIKESNNYIA